jgi:hypothetical protein
MSFFIDHKDKARSRREDDDSDFSSKSYSRSFTRFWDRLVRFQQLSDGKTGKIQVDGKNREY